MQLDLVRKMLTAESTIGELSIDGRFQCVTLEDVVRNKKIPDQTAIPAGSYEMVINQSARFQRLMPRLLNVPGFEGILIHWGNTAADTSGCILVGESTSKNFIGSSRVAFDALFTKLSKAVAAGARLSITVT